MIIRVLYIIEGLHGGGKERQLIEIVKMLSHDTSMAIGLITFNKNQHYSIVARDTVKYFKELNKRPNKFEPLISIWKCFREFKPNIVHTWDSLSSFYAFLPCKLKKIKLIEGSIRDAGIERGCQYYYKRFFLREADLILANSYAGLEAYNVNGGVIYNAINPIRFLTKIDNKEFNLIMTANFTDFKDHETFLKAVIHLIKENLIDKAFLLGDGPHKEKYIKWIYEEGSLFREKIIFTGAVKNVEEYLAKCNIGVLCSTSKYSEGVSNSDLEYMAAGLIPIVTNLGGSAEIIEDGINGFLINPGDSGSLIDRVKKIKMDESLASKIRQEAKLTIENKFNHVNNIKQLELIYKNLMKN